MGDIEVVRLRAGNGGIVREGSAHIAIRVSLSFEEAVLSAKDSEAEITFDPETSNPHFSFIEDDGKRHEVWFLDGVTAFNEIHAADAYRPAGYAVWRLGSEDPTIWSVLQQNYGVQAPGALHRIGMSEDIDFEGEGELLRVGDAPAEGARTFEVDGDTGQIVDEKYSAVPTPFVIQRSGDLPGKIALTFDDGPSPYTSQVLDRLQRYEAKATFFVIGRLAQAQPELLQRIETAGHTLGNHTYDHRSLRGLTEEAFDQAVEETQVVLGEHTSKCLRPPYGSTDAHTVAYAAKLGYALVLWTVDPRDWRRPGAAVIARHVVTHAAPGAIVVLHDGGGDRSQTVAALEIILRQLTAQGYHFAALCQEGGHG